MVKLCLKKFLWMICYGALFFAVYLIGFSLLTTLGNFFRNMEITYLIVAAVPAAIIAVIIYNRRRDNSENKRKYISDNKDTKMTFKNKALYILKSKEFRAEIIASMPIVLFIAVSVSSNFSFAWYTNLLFGIFAFCFDEMGFAALDFLLWFRVHRYWGKNSVRGI